METSKRKQKPEQIEVVSERAIIYIPHNAIEVEIVAKVYNGSDKIETLSYTMGMDEVRESLRKAEEGYIDEDDRFEITEKGIAYLDSLRDG